MATKHSPAPFHRGGKDGRIIYDFYGRPVADCIVFYGKANEGLMERNAVLFAAAPQLLEACKKTLTTLKAWNKLDGAWREVEEILTAAIAAAEGA